MGVAEVLVVIVALVAGMGLAEMMSPPYKHTIRDLVYGCGYKNGQE